MFMRFPLPSRPLHLSILASSIFLAACSDSGSVDSSSGPELTAPVTTSGSQLAVNGADNSAATSAPENTTAENTTPENSTTLETGTSDGSATAVATVDNSSAGTSAAEQAQNTTQPDNTSVTEATESSATPPAVADSTATEDPAESVAVVAPNVSGSDATGGEDDSPTATETASLVGPFIKDTNRPDGPPSVPQGLTLLMAGENFVEFTWEPSTDDQSVEGYEVYRDGTLAYTIRGDTNFEFDYRSWITTSYIDCNYTRYTICDANPIIPGSSYEYRIAAIDNEGMKSALSEPVIFQMAQRQSGGVDLTGYSPIFNEEFDADTLDRTFWKTSLPWGPNEIVNRESQYFVNLFGSDPLPANPFVMTGSTLQITGTTTPPELLARANNQPYLSGVISTKDKFKMTYGYVEMNAKVTSGQGFLSTFFLFNQDFEKNKPEIDILEYNGGKPTTVFQTYHYHDSNRFRRGDGERHSTPTMESVVPDLSADFHTYGVLWEPGLIVWYIDGEEVRRLTGVRVSDEPMNIVAQLVVGSEWIGEPDPASLPKTFEIDYIKAWQKQP